MPIYGNFVGLEKEREGKQLSKGERRIGQLAHFISLGLSPSHNSSALSQGERGMGRISHIQFLRRPSGYGRRP